MDDINKIGVVRIWTLEEIKNRLETSDAMVERSLLKLYERQTSDEQEMKTTRWLNGRGFNSKDVKFASGLAKIVEEKRHLSPKQIAAVRKMLWKYSGQLLRIANGEA